MDTRDIRETFLDFFAGKGHERVASSSLVPHDDPTLLFTNAGMVQFKDVFTGHDTRAYNRATTSQRCVRAGGKHNDLDNVGYTARHHTFFEMLGNFSFGDYFKEQAIEYAWELLTVNYGLPEEKLWVTVFEEDDEAADIWMKKIGVPESRFAWIGAHDNFWAMGDTGPCGPCSEIFYDHGPAVAGGPPGTPEEDGDRYIEIWNLVFMQFNKQTATSSMEPLPKPSVDTGMGLERLAAILQGVHSNYEIDLFRRLIDAAADVTGINNREDKSLRVIADHIRSTGFLIADGVTPSNEGRGYVLRRIIRRAIRHGYQSGGEARFMHKLVAPLVDEMGDAFPELRDASAHVERVLEQEGTRFAETLDQGLKILDDEISALDEKMIPGDVVFKLYDTYGFPVDLTNDVAREHGLEIDTEGFESAMEGQRSRARASSNFAAVDRVHVQGIEASGFCGYDSLDGHSEVVALVQGSEQADVLTSGDDGVVVLARTPFYAESGGQVGDLGVIETAAGARFAVSDTQKMPGGIIAHHGRLERGTLNIGETASARVDADHRAQTVCNHSATHLLHAALQEVLGEHVQQKGSLVAPDRLRFDFSHFSPVSAEEIDRIETIVNAQIRANHAVDAVYMDLDEAKQAGAAALFGEKYDQNVRTIRMGDASFELCGGTHVARTGDIGLMKIVSETGVAAGIRRVEALTGAGALDWLRRQNHLVERLAASVKAGRDEVEDKVANLVGRNKELEREVNQLRARVAVSGSGSDPSETATEVAGVKILMMRRDGIDPKSLRSMIDQLKNKLGSGVVVIGTARDDKVSILAGVSKDLTPGLHAGQLVSHLAGQVGGKGGGKPDMAQGGGTDAAALDSALDSVVAWVEQNAGNCVLD